MHLPHQIQQDLEAWVTAHGLSAEAFIVEAIAEKLTKLKQQSESPTPPEAAPVTYDSSRLRHQEGILVIDVAPLKSFDTNAFIDELREERIQEQGTL